jgi:hypothetical protein
VLEVIETVKQVSEPAQCFPVALSDSFRAAKRLWDSSNVIETVAGHAGEQRLHIM